MSNYDLIVVGAGFAGLACARAAASQNVNTLVLEHKWDSGSYVHTTGILVKEIAEQWDVPDRLVRRINGVRLYSPSLKWCDLFSPGYYFLATDTVELLRWHAKQAVTAGAKIHYNCTYQRSVFENNQHILKPQGLKCRYLVGSDGVRSRVARQYGLGINKKFLVGVEAIYEPVEGIVQDRLHVFLDSQLAPGYVAWIVPGIECTQIGLATRYPATPHLEKFLKKISKLVDLKKSCLISRRSGLIPCGGPVNNNSGENVLLLGDAAGMVSPMTAGGIHPAIEMGEIAGNAIQEYLYQNGTAPYKILNSCVPGYFYKNMLRNLSDQLLLSNTVIDQIFNTRIFRAIAQMFFFHKRGLLSKQAWQDFKKLINNQPVR